MKLSVLILALEIYTCNAGIEVEVIVAAAQRATRISGCDDLSPQALLDGYAKTVTMSNVALQAAQSLLKVCQWEPLLSGGPSLPNFCNCLPPKFVVVQYWQLAMTCQL